DGDILLNGARVTRASRARIGGDDVARRPVDAQDRARHEIAARGVEKERLADLRRARVRDDPARAAEADAAVDPVLQRQMSAEPLAAAPVAHRDAEILTDVVLRVARHEDLVDATLSSFECRHGTPPRREPTCRMSSDQKIDAPALLAPDNFTPPSRTPWGGRRIRALKRRWVGEGEPVGESWELSVEPSFPSRCE